MNTILSGQEILRLVQQKPALIENYIKLDDQVQPNGFDLTLREVARPQFPGMHRRLQYSAPGLQSAKL